MTAVAEVTDVKLTTGQVKLLGYVFRMAGMVFSKKCQVADRKARQAVLETPDNSTDALEEWAHTLAEFHAEISQAATSVVARVPEPFPSIVMAQDRVVGAPFDDMIREVFELAGLSEDYEPLPRR